MLNIKRKLKQQKQGVTTINSIFNVIPLVFTLINAMMLEDPLVNTFWKKNFTEVIFY